MYVLLYIQGSTGLPFSFSLSLSLSLSHTRTRIVYSPKVSIETVHKQKRRNVRVLFVPMKTIDVINESLSLWKHGDQQICRIRRKFFSLCALIFYFDLRFCKNILNFSPGQNKFFGVLIINSEVHYDLCQDILIICDFSSINLSMEHIERSHLTNRLPNFHRSLTLYHDFFLHERCGAKIIEHPLAE